MRLSLGGRDYDVTTRALVMGILNRTPDSFFDKGSYWDLDEFLKRADRLVSEGADILDVGGVKAGPGPEVTEAEELDRVIPAVTLLRERFDVPLSIETARAVVAEKAIEAGAAIVNDVTSLSDVTIADVCARTGAALVLMHSGGQVRGRPRAPQYPDIVVAVVDEWKRLAALATAAGVPNDALIVDAGLDFGKNTFHSLELMRRLDEQVALGWPLLVAPSRKDVVGETLGLALDDRLEGTLALVALSVADGAAIVRVHDVMASVRTVHMVEAVKGSRKPSAPVRGLWD